MLLFLILLNHGIKLLLFSEAVDESQFFMGAVRPDGSIDLQNLVNCDQIKYLNLRSDIRIDTMEHDSCQYDVNTFRPCVIYLESLRL